MSVPTDKPQFVEVIRGVGNGDLFLSLKTNKKWWQFWRPHAWGTYFIREHSIWLYQAIAKMLRPRLENGDTTELYDDLHMVMQGVWGADYQKDRGISISEIVRLMEAKGWRKL